MALWYTIADISLIWQVVYYSQCVTTQTKCEQEEYIALIAPKNLKNRRRSNADRSLSKADTNTMEMQHSDESEAEYDEDNELLENKAVVVLPPKIKPVWVNLIGGSILVIFTLFSCYAYVMVSGQPVQESSDDSLRLVPQILGWLSAVLYVGSRLPQLIKNWKQQSTEGLSSGMFICAVFGNLFFALVWILIEHI